MMRSAGSTGRFSWLAGLAACAFLTLALFACLAGCAAVPQSTAPAPAPTALPDRSELQQRQQYTLTVMLDRKPVPEAIIFMDGAPLTTTLPAASNASEAGTFAAFLPEDSGLVALVPVSLSLTSRLAHDFVAGPLVLSDGAEVYDGASLSVPGWKHQVYLTSLAWDASGTPSATVLGDTQDVTLAVQRERPLFLFNVVVSIEWDADEEYLDDFAAAMRGASTYLWDLTDGQMAFGQVRIYDRSENWAGADIRVVARNTEYPHASIGGSAEWQYPERYRIMLGPYWSRDLTTKAGGRWSLTDGYRTIAHEFGHYALGLFDEYRGVDEKEGCTATMPADDGKGIGASAMNWQYETSELSAHDVDKLWADACEHTLQWQFDKQAPWQAIVERFDNPPHWQVAAPDAAAGGPKPGDWPEALASLPVIGFGDTALAASGVAPFTISTMNSAGNPVRASAVLKPSNRTCGVDLGATSPRDGSLWVAGGQLGDTLFVEVGDETPVCGILRLDSAVQADTTVVLTAKTCAVGNFPACEDIAYGTDADQPQWLIGLVDGIETGSPEITGWEFVDAGSPQVQFQFDSDLAAEVEAPAHRAFGFLRGEPSDKVARLQGAYLCRLPAAQGVRNCFGTIDIGVAAYLVEGVQPEPASTQGAAAYSSSDGRLQVFRQPDNSLSSLIILDAPVSDEAGNKDNLEPASRMYYLVGGADAMAKVQIQSECCAASEGAADPILVEIAHDSEYYVNPIGGSFYPREGYVLGDVSINHTGAFAVMAKGE